MIEENSLFHDNNRNRVTVLFLKYINNHGYKYRTILKGVFPLLLSVCDNGYIECNSYCDPHEIEENLFETVMLNFGANDICLVPLILIVPLIRVVGRRVSVACPPFSLS